MVDRFTVKNAGQISKAEIEFGDLTILVGAQGTGKSLFLQLFKLYHDQNYIKKMMMDYGKGWNEHSKPDFINVYMGDGMSGIWDTKHSSTAPRFSPSTKNMEQSCESVYYIPAQRAVTMPDGWPQPFRSYSNNTPFAVKNFSESIRLYLENNGGTGALFPINGKLKQPIKDNLNRAIFHNATVSQELLLGQKELRLHVQNNKSGDGLPYITWSSGQREFMPLLLGCYRLLPGGKYTKDKDIEYVIIEEPERGLHPKAIFAVMNLVIDLLSRGYKVIMSTHSTSVLDIVWAINEISSTPLLPDIRVSLVCKMLGLTESAAPDSGLQKMISTIFEKTLKTYYFRYDEEMKVHTMDISSLDPGDKRDEVSGWGGLSGYSGRAAEVVSEAVERSENDEEN